MKELFNILRSWFKEKPSLDEWVNAHEPTSITEVEHLERTYEQFLSTKTY
jgi:hypothetical protein